MSKMKERFIEQHNSIGHQARLLAEATLRMVRAYKDLEQDDVQKDIKLDHMHYALEDAEGEAQNILNLTGEC